MSVALFLRDRFFPPCPPPSSVAFYLFHWPRRTSDFDGLSRAARNWSSFAANWPQKKKRVETERNETKRNETGRNEAERNETRHDVTTDSGRRARTKGGETRRSTPLNRPPPPPVYDTRGERSLFTFFRRFLAPVHSREAALVKTFVWTRADRISLRAR